MSNNSETSGNGKMVFELFPQEYLDLSAELATDYHPKLQSILSRFPYEELDMKLAQIAAYCEVGLDGEYTLDKRINLCKILLQRLILKRELPEAQKIILIN